MIYQADHWRLYGFYIDSSVSEQEFRELQNEYDAVSEYLASHPQLAALYISGMLMYESIVKLVTDEEEREWIQDKSGGIDGNA